MQQKHSSRSRVASPSPGYRLKGVRNRDRGTPIGWWCALLAFVTLSARASGAVTVHDDTGHTVTLVRPARRVVSLAPSTTEMLFAIDAGRELVGVSSADDYPPSAKKLPKVGSFSGPDLERIVAARPDLVVAAYGNPLELLDRLRRMSFPVYVSNPTTISGVFRDMMDLGAVTGQQNAARREVHGLQKRLDQVAARVHGQSPVKTLVVIWDEPLTVAGRKSFIQDILRLSGGVNAAAGLATAYPKLDPELLPAMDPQVVIFPLSDDPGRLEHLKVRPGFRQTRAASSRQFFSLNPDWLMRPGPRVVEGVEAVSRLLHPAGAQHQASH